MPEPDAPTGTRPARFLRPEHLVANGDTAWLVDSSRPAAVVVAPGAAPVLVTWPHEPTAPQEYDRTVVANGVGIVVQDHDDVTFVDRTGSLSRHRIDDRVSLLAADSEYAWFADVGQPDVGKPGPGGAFVPPPLEPGRVVAVAADGRRHDTITPGPVRGIQIVDAGIVLTMSELPIFTVHGGFEYPRTIRRYERLDLLDGRLGASAATTPRRMTEWQLLVAPNLGEHDHASTVLNYGHAVGGRLWMAGHLPGNSGTATRAAVTAHDPTTEREELSIDLGAGHISTVRPVGDELWLVIDRASGTRQDEAPQYEVVAVTTTGEVRTILLPEAVDISAAAPPLVACDDDVIRRHIDESREPLADLMHFWHNAKGMASPLSDGLTRSAVDVVNDWPETRLVLTMQHAAWPGLTLRRTYRLFDESGQPIFDDEVALTLAEDIDAGGVPPAAEAVDGVLDI